jgi:PAS domain S-box-containing protein
LHPSDATPDCPPALRLVAATLSATRGHLLQFDTLFEGSQVPILMVGSHRQFTEANAAAWSLIRMSLNELRRHRIDDLIAPTAWPRMELAWRKLLGEGSLSGRYRLRLRDGSRVWVFYAAVANVLSAQHVIAFAPAAWPADALQVIQAAGDAEGRGALSPRQCDVLRLIARGAGSGQVARELSISEATVRTHVRNILERLGARNRAHAVALATATRQLGAIPTELH